jgi:hypothetical protein
MYLCAVNIACHVKQSIIGFRSSQKGEQVLKTNVESVGRWRLPRWQRILSRRFPGTCETVGQVFKCVWGLCWKINVVCMSLSPFVSFQSWFVTYLLMFPRTLLCFQQPITTSYSKLIELNPSRTIRPVFWYFTPLGQENYGSPPPPPICSYSVMCKQKQHKTLTKDKTL